MKINCEYLKFFPNNMDILNLRYDEKVIKEHLLSFDSPSRFCINDDFFTKSAVIFTIIPHDDKPYELVIIHRTDKGEKHGGEMSFPGGKFDSTLDKSLKDTALRECEEEIGVPRNQIKILGCLHDFPTMTQYIITPFVGIINKDQELIRDQREVQEIITVPINFFTEKSSFKETATDFEGKPFPVFFFLYTLNNRRYMIWGATAYMITSFIKLIYGHDLSKLGLRRFTVDEIKSLKSHILNLNNKKLSKRLKRFNIE